MEIGNAYSELNDPQEQKKRFMQQVEEKTKVMKKLNLMMQISSQL